MSSIVRKSMQRGLLSILVLLTTGSGALAQAPVWTAVMRSDQIVQYYKYSATDFVEDNGSFTSPRPPHPYSFISSHPAAGTRRNTCQLTSIPSWIYGQEVDWFNFADNSLANGSYPFAPPSEFSVNSYDPGPLKGFSFHGTFGGTATSSGGSNSFFIEAAYFTDRACSDAGVEFGFYRIPAAGSAVPSGSNGSAYQQNENEVTFYYSNFTNCNDDFFCRNSTDPASSLVLQNTYFLHITNIPRNAVAQTYEYYYDVYPINNGTQFWVELIDPRTFTNPTGCQVYLNRLPNGWPDFTSCGFAVPIQSWFPLQHTTSGYMVLATQTNRNDISPGVSNGCLNALEIKVGK